MLTLSGVNGELLTNERLDNYTTWRVGGVARYLYKPTGIDDLQILLKQLPAELPVMWLGLGSNTLIRDGGFEGLVVLTQGRLRELNLTQQGNVYVEAGTACATMARFCARHNKANAEFWAGIPGTMGGALRMNAGCFNGETWDNLVSVCVLTRQGKLEWRDKAAFEIAYRHVTGLALDEWFVAATFNFEQGEKAVSLSNIKQLLQRRTRTQPTGEFNCGSVFRNPEGNFAAKLIESCGLKGRNIGGAFVSDKHANFITNDGTACAQDIESLIETVAVEVSNSVGVSLNCEVHIHGNKEGLA